MNKPYTAVPLSPIRKVIAARMTEVASTIPHFRACVDAELDELLKVREEMHGQDSAPTPSINDLMIKACACALMDTPALNIQWVDGEIRRYPTADIAVVIALDDGLSTPIVRRAESKTVGDISREVKALAERAKSNALKIDDVFGGTFTISNLGMHGVDQFDAIINPPQCAILAIGRAATRCVVTEDRRVGIATTVRLTLSVDHRAIDGAVAAAFLKALKTHVERPGDLFACR